MSWASMEWKDGLPGRALQKIEELEQQLEKLKRERLQKQCQMDTLEQAIEKQKRKLEEDRIANARVVKENQSLLDTCEELERKRQKVEHDLQAKESYVACLEGQLSHSKQATEAEIAKVTQLKLELDRMTSASQALTIRAEKQATDSARLQDLCNHLRKQVDDQRDQLASMQFSLKQNSGSCHTASRQPSSLIHAPGLSHEQVALTNETIRFQQRISELEALLAQAADEKQKAVAELHQTQESVRNDVAQANSMVHALTQEKTNLQINLSNKQSSSASQLANIESNLNDGQTELKQQISKLSADNDGLKRTIESLKQQVQDSGLKLQMAEEKAKKIQLEAECHRHNAESIRLSVDQKLKDKEKDFRLDLSHVQNELKDCANRLTQQTASSQKEVNKLTCEMESLRSQLDKVSARNAALERQSTDERERLASVDNLVAEHKKALASLDANIKALNTEKDHQLTSLEDRDRQIVNLNSEISSLKSRLKLADEANDNMRGKMLDYQLETESLQELLNKRTEDHETSQGSLKAENELLKTQMEQISNKSTQDSERHKELVDQIAAAQSESNSLRQLLNEKEAQCEELLQQAKSRDHQLESAEIASKDTLSKLQCQLEEVSLSLASREKELAELSAQLSQQSCELEETKHKLSSLDVSYQTAEQKIQDQQKTIIELESAELRFKSSLQEAELLKQSLKAEVESLRVIVEQMTSKSSSDTSKHQELSERFDKEIAQSDFLQQQLTDKSELCCQLAAQVKELNEQLESLSLAHKDTASELSILRASSSELLESKDTSLLQLSDELANKNLEIDQLKNELSRMIAQYEEAETKAQHLQEAVVALEKSEASTNSALADRARDVEELTEEIDLMHSANKLANQANDKLHCIVQECRDKIQCLEKCLDSTTQENEVTKCGMQSEIDSLKSNAHFMSEKLLSLDLQKDELLASLEVAKAECESLGLQLANKDDLCGQLNDQLKISHDNYMSLQLTHQDTLQVLQSQISHAKETLALKERESMVNSEQLAHQNTELSTMRDELLSLKERCSQYEVTLCAKEEQIVSFKKLAVKQSNILIDNEAEISKLKEDNISLKSCVDLTAQAQADLRRKVQTLQHELKDLKDQYEMLGRESDKMQSSLSEEVTQLKAKNNQLSDELSRVSFSLQESSSDLSTLKTELDLVIHQLAEKNALCVEQSCQVIKLNEQLESLRLQHTDITAAYSKEHAVLRETIDSRNNDLKQLNDQLSELTNELNAVKNDLDVKEQTITLLQNSAEKQQLQDKLEVKHLELEKANEQIKELSLRGEQLMTVNQDVQNELMSVSSVQLSLQKELDLLQSKLDTSNKTNDELLTRLKTQEELLDRTKSEWSCQYEALTGAKALVDQSLEHSLIELNQAKIDVQNISAARDELSEKVSSLELQITKLLIDIDDSSAQKEAALLQLETVSREKDSVELQLRSMEQQILYVESDYDGKVQILQKALDCALEDKTVLTTKLDSLISDVERFRSESDELANDLREEKQQSQQLNQLYDNQLLVVTNLQQDLKSAMAYQKTVTEQYEHLLEDTRSSIASYEKDKDILREQIAQLTGENLLLTTRIETMQTRIATLESDQKLESSEQIDELQKEIHRLKEQLTDNTDQHRVQVTEASQFVLELKREVHDLELVKAKLSDQLGSKENHLTQVTNELSRALGALDESNSQIEQLEKDLVANKKEIENMTASLESTCNKLKAAEIQVENYFSQLQTISEDVKRVSVTNADMESKIDSCHNNMMSSPTKADRKFDDLVQMNDSLTRVNESLERQIDEISKLASHKQSALDEYTAFNNALEKEIGELRIQLETEGMRIAELHNEITALKGELEEEKRISGFLKNQLESCSLLEQQLADKNDELDEVKNENRHNQIELERHITEAEQLRLKITQLTETVVKLEENCFTLNVDLDRLKLAILSSNAEKQEFLLHNQELMAQIDSLKAASEKQAEELRIKDDHICNIQTTIKDIELKAEQQSGETAELREKLKSANEERSHLCTVIDKVSEDNQLLSRMMQENKLLVLEDKASIEDEFVECRRTVEQLKKVLEADSAAQSQLSDQVSDLEASVSSLNFEKHELEQKLLDSASSESCLKIKTSELEDQLVVFKNKIDVLEKSLANEVQLTTLGKKQVSDFMAKLNLAQDQEKALLEKLNVAELAIIALKRELDSAHDQEKSQLEKLNAADLVASALKRELDSARDREKTLLEKLNAADLVASALKRESDSARDQEKILSVKLEAADRNSSFLKHELDSAQNLEKKLLKELDTANLSLSALRCELDSARGKERTQVEPFSPFVQLKCENIHSEVPDESFLNDSNRLIHQNSMSFSQDGSSMCELSSLKSESKDCSVGGRKRVVKRFTRSVVIAPKFETEVQPHNLTETNLVKTKKDVEVCDRLASSLMLEQTGKELTGACISSALEKLAVIEQSPLNSAQISSVTGDDCHQFNRVDICDTECVSLSCDTRLGVPNLELKDAVNKSVHGTPSNSVSSIQPYVLRSGKRRSFDDDGSSRSAKRHQDHGAMAEASLQPSICAKVNRKSRVTARCTANVGVVNEETKMCRVPVCDDIKGLLQNVPLSTITNSPGQSLSAACSLRETQQIPLHTSSVLKGVDDLNSVAPLAGMHRSRRQRATAVGVGTTSGDLKDKAECKVQ